MAYIKLKQDEKVIAFVNDAHIVSLEPSYEGTVIVKTVTGDLYKSDFVHVQHLTASLSGVPQMLTETVELSEKKK